MESLEEKLNRTLDLLRLEVQEANPLPSQYVKALHSLIGGQWSGKPIYYTNSSLITEVKQDADLIMERATGSESLFKIESQHFELGFYAISIIENKQLFALIDGITPPKK